MLMERSMDRSVPRSLGDGEIVTSKRLLKASPDDLMLSISPEMSAELFVAIYPPLITLILESL